MANVSFHIGTTDPTVLGTTIEGGIYVNQTGGGIYYAPGGVDVIPIASKVHFTQLVTTGTKLGTIKINGASKDLYYRNTLNTAGGTATNEKLFFVGMKSDNVDSAQTYTNSYCYALGSNLYSNGYKCATVRTTTVQADIRIPTNVGDMKTVYYTLTEADFDGALLGYTIEGFRGVSSVDWELVTQGVTIGDTTCGVAPSYKIGAKVTRIRNSFTPLLSDDAVVFTVYYIPYFN